MNASRNIWLEEEDQHLLAECVLDFHKASGNGGQKVNKTSSAVRLIHAPSGLSVAEAGNRSQNVNRNNALKKLRLKIAMTVRCAVSGEAPLPAPSLSNRAYPLWLAVLLDHLRQNQWDVRRTAQIYGLSSSKLIKLIYRDAALWQELNRQRTAAGLAPLRGTK